MKIITLLAIIVLGGAIIIILKKGFNELIKGLEAINEKITNIEDKIDREQN